MTRTKRNNSILCWLLAVTLAWLPLSVSADASMLSASTTQGHEINSALHGHAGMHSMEDGAILKKTCCDDCGSSNSCTEISGYNNKTGEISSFIVMDQNFTQYFQLVQSDTRHPARYHSLTSGPNIRPPIV